MALVFIYKRVSEVDRALGLDPLCYEGDLFRSTYM